MFKRIEIKLAGPICNCDEQTLGWNIIFPGPGLEINCKTCKVELRIPTEKFVAAFVLEKPYPGKTEKKIEAPKTELKVLDGGKVIEFKKNEDTSIKS